MRPGQGRLPLPEQGYAQCPMGYEQEGGVLPLLGQAQQLAPQLTGQRQLRSQERIPPEAKQHREELSGVSYLLTQLARPGVERSHFFWSRKAPDIHQHWTQGEVQPEFVLGALRRVWQSGEEL